jgi:dipeptidyl aminopeptidase/acylaminoacyl peptidase
MSRSFRRLSIFIAVLGTSSTYGQGGSESTKRPIAVSDCIAMTRWAGSGSFFGGDLGGQVASFSPDGRRFVLVLKKGNLENNTNEFSLHVFETRDAFRSPNSEAVLAMASSSNRDAIREIKWLDSETIAFLGENPDQPAQVYKFNLKTRRLERLTSHPLAIVGYDITADSREIVFAAVSPPTKFVNTEPTRRSGIVISNQDLPVLLAGDGASPWERELFLQKQGQEAVRISMEDVIYDGNPLSLSPSGRYALVGVYARDIPAAWEEYRSNDIRRLIGHSKDWKSEYTSLSRFLLVDTKDDSVMLLLDAPTKGFHRTAWAQNGRSIFIARTYLPLGVKDPTERETRERSTYDIEIDIPTLSYQKIGDHGWPKSENPVPALEVSLVQDLNTPPRVYVSDPKTNRKAMLLDLNPQFDELRFGEAKTIDLNVRGIEILAGLYLPPDYQPGKRYPLVIQTHGFLPKEFSMDGLSEWSSGFAARPLAAHDFVVLQLHTFKNREDHDRIDDGTDKRFGATPELSGKNQSALMYEAGIDYLDKEEMIDRDRVGIVGFSRTVCFVAYTLTHSRYRFAAATLVVGIDCGYLQRLVFPGGSEDDDLLNGGKAPFGEDGLEQWLRESPGFNLDKVTAPVRLVALQPFAVLEMWEWFAGLRLQHKPVELVELPDASHLIVKPWERLVAQQGLVDWFRFWLKGAEDSDPAKVGQYTRWRELRKTGSALSSIPEP